MYLKRDCVTFSFSFMNAGYDRFQPNIQCLFLPLNCVVLIFLSRESHGVLQFRVPQVGSAHRTSLTKSGFHWNLPCNRHFPLARGNLYELYCQKSPSWDQSSPRHLFCSADHVLFNSRDALDEMALHCGENGFQNLPNSPFQDEELFHTLLLRKHSEASKNGVYPYLGHCTLGKSDASEELLKKTDVCMPVVLKIHKNLRTSRTEGQ